MALGKAIFAEPLNLFETALGETGVIPTRRHAADKLAGKAVDGAHMAKGGHGAPELIGFRRGEAGGDDGDAHGLFLKQWHTQGLVQNLAKLVGGAKFGRRGRIFHHLLAIPAAQIGMHHVALNGARADNRHFNHQVIEIPWFKARQHVHLGAAFNLKHANRVSPAEHVIGGGIAARQPRQAHGAAIMHLQQGKGLADTGQHAQRQTVDFKDPQRVQIILIPLDDSAVFHRRIGDGHHLVKRCLGQHEAPHMLR